MSETNLKIIAFDSPKAGQHAKPYNEFTVVFNPSSFAVNNKIDFKKPQAKGKTGGDPQFDKIPPLEFAVDFVIDGTGIGPDKSGHGNSDYVKNKVRLLREVTGSQINGEIHRPNYLALLWGTFYIECVLTSLNITYTLFDREGSPLRGKISCHFLERIGSDKEARSSRLESPDLTKFVTVKAGDTLDLIAETYYGDPSRYLQLARANKLANFRRLVPGTQLIIPPIAHTHEK